MSTDRIIKCSSANKCTKMNVVTFCHNTWSMHLINLLLHHLIIQLLCPNAYVIWQWAQHVCTWLYDTLQQARPGSLKCDKACSAHTAMHVPFLASTSDHMTVRLPVTPTPSPTHYLCMHYVLDCLYSCLLQAVHAFTTYTRVHQLVHHQCHCHMH